MNSVAIFAPIKLAAQMTRKLKQIPTRIVKKIPIVSDYYRYYWCFPRQISACRGVFNTFSEALQALPSGSLFGYSQPEIDRHSSVAVAQLTARRNLGELGPTDYPVLQRLASAFKDSSTVFDLGGNVGVAYYGYQKHIQYPDNLRWLVCELPEIVKAGEDLARETDSPGLSFTVEFSDAEGSDILLTCGALQYIEPTLAELLAQLKAKPRHILINHVPFYNGTSFITLQNIGYACTPYKIQNRDEFLAALYSLGYELIDSWEDNRNCYIPFHPERFVDAYHSFYLRLNKEAVQ